jgi:biotin carboxylase
VTDERPPDRPSDAAGHRPKLVIVEPTDSFFHYLEVAHEHGFDTVVLSGSPETCRHRERVFNHSLADCDVSRIDHLLSCNPGDAGSVVASIRQFGRPVAGLIAGDDHFVPVVAAAGRALGFNYALPEDALAQQRKSLMKIRLAAHDVPTPRFAIVTDLAAARAAWRSFGCDAIVKMVDYQGSMNVYRALTEDALAAAWDAIRSNVHQVDISMALSTDVLIEEYVPGRELSAEGYVQDDQVVILNYCGKITGPNFIVVGHLMPVELSSTERAAAAASVEGCVKALGIRNAVFHIELHLADNTAYVIEASARPPGQHMVELMRRAYGWDLMGIVVDLAVGAPTNAQPTAPRAYYAMAAFYAQHTGVLSQISNLEALRARPEVLRLKLDLAPGDTVHALTTFRDRYGFVITEHASSAEAQEAFRWIRDHVRLEVLEANAVA